MFVFKGEVFSGSSKNEIFLATRISFDTNWIIYGNAGNDTLIGGRLGDRIFGGVGNDYLSGGDGNDTLSGGAGNDTLIGGLGINYLDGGSGIDTVYYSFIKKGIQANLATGMVAPIKGNGFKDTLKNVENLIGSSGNDIIIGSKVNNTLWGDNGKDSINGGAGDDTLDGGAGEDTLAGSSGNDTFVVNSIRDVVIEDFEAGTDTVISSTNYTLADNVENLTLKSAARLGVGNSLDNLISTAGNLSYTLEGASGNDTLLGGGRDDSLDGGTGDDFLKAYGDDGGEIDYLTGGQGADTFILGDEENGAFYYHPGSIWYQEIPEPDTAIITDFTIADGDLIQLYGAIEEYYIEELDYTLGSSAPDSLIYLQEEGLPSALIAIVRDVTGLDLGSNSFNYVV